MSNKGIITKEDIFQQDAVNAPKEYAVNLELAIKNQQRMIEIAKEWNGLSSSAKQIKSTKELNTIQQKHLGLTEQTQIAYKEQDRLEKNLITTKVRQEQATESTNRALIKERLELNKTNREIKEQAIITSNLIGAYQKLNLKRTQAKKTLLDLLASEKASNKEIEKARRNYDLLDKKVRKADESVGDFSKKVGNYKTGVSGLTSGIRSLVGAFGAVEGIKLAFRIGADLMELQSEVKGIDFAFQRVGVEGVVALDKVRNSTRGLLSDLDIKKAIVDFDNFNLSLENMDTLMEFAVVRSAQTGKSVEYMLDSLKEGLSKGSLLRLDNLGVSMTDMKKQMDDFGLSVVDAFSKVAGEEVKEAGNILDEAGDSQAKWNASLENFKVTLSGSSFLTKFSDGLFAVGNRLLEVITPSKDLNIQLEDQAKKVLDLNKNLNPLVSEYDNLKLKTNLSKTEQERLKTVITDISKIVPTAISQFDQYGNALDINSDKAKEFVKNQKALLVFRNKEALEEEKEALQDYRKEIEGINKILSFRNDEGDIIQNVVKGGKVARVEQKKLSADYIAQKQAELARLQQLEIGAQQSIDQLSGDYLEKYVAREKDKTAKELEQLQIKAKALKINIEGKTASELKNLISKKENTSTTNKTIKDDSKKLNESLKQSEFELAQEQMQMNIDKNESIINNENATFEEKFKAIQQLKIAQNDFNNNQINEDKRLLKQRLDNNDILQDEYIARLQILGIKSIGINEDLENQITENLKKALGDRLEAQKNSVDENIKAYQAKANAQKKIDEISLEERKKAISLISEFTANAFGVDANNLDKFITGLIDGFGSFKEGLTATLAVAGDVMNTITSISADFSQARIEQIDFEIEKNDEKFNKLLANEELTLEQRSLLEAQKQREQDKLEKKKREEKTKQAKLEKANALTQIAIQTALGITKAVALSPLTGGLPFSAIVAGIGAVQFALAAARPIPKFKDGHLAGTHQGWAITNDGGKQEILERNGMAHLIQGVNTPIYMQKGDKVYKSEEDYHKRVAQNAFKDLNNQRNRVEKAQQIVVKNQQGNFIIKDMKELISETKKNSEILKKKNLSVNIQKTNIDINHEFFRNKNTNWG
tara:strand:- start:2369 stop:5692 length:3324 start_codon:yes stop_codon:yes gene_type:complete